MPSGIFAYLCLLRMQDLFAIFSGHPIIAINVARYLQGQRDAAVSTVEDLAFLKVSERIVRLFERLSHDHGLADRKGTRIDVHLTHADIASCVPDGYSAATGTSSCQAQSNLPESDRFSVGVLTILRI
jgi:CRP-like cAMP-binding protein